MENLEYETAYYQVKDDVIDSLPIESDEDIAFD